MNPLTASLISVGWHSSPTAPPTFEFPFAQAPLFIIQFSKYDLNNNVLYDPANANTQDFVNYIIDPTQIPGQTQVTIDSANPPHWIVYDHVQPQHFTLNAPPQTFDPIKVAFRFGAPTGPEDAGWIDLDISFSYPSQFALDAANFAWQAQLVFPHCRIDKTATVQATDGNVPASEWSVLLPGGDMGRIADIDTSQGPIVHGMPVQLAALYKSGELLGDNLVSGVLFAATDTLGQEKSFLYSNVTAQQSELDCYFTSPVHLKTVNGKPNYVQPIDAADTRFNFTLSRGDNYGYGGGKMHYRIKATQVLNYITGAPTDWTDLANVYRKWVKANRPGFFSKQFSRTPGGPMDNMSPFTVITNYALDGPISGTANDPKLPAKWLEIFPIKVDGKTDMPNNDNTPLQERLKQIRKRANNTFNDARLEAQMWGYESGGYYQWIGGYPPLTNIISSLHDQPNRFRMAMDELAGSTNQIFASITTDLIGVLFNRGRFRGHVLKSGTNWVEAINHPFPAELTDPNHNPSACKFVTSATLTRIDGSTFFSDRLFIVRAAFDAHPTCPNADKLFPYVQYAAHGPALFLGVLYSRFYNQGMRGLCPQNEVVDTYLTSCLNNGAFKYGARLIEFMKVGFHACYKKEHQHIFTSTAGLPYDNVIGLGAWTTARLQQVFTRIQRLGQGLDPRSDGVHDPTFALTREGAPTEPQLSYLNEFYHRSPVLQYVYGETISTKMDLVAACPHTHPGYQDRRKPINGQPPTSFAPIGPFFSTDYTPSTLPSRHRWWQAAWDYSNQYFDLINPGLSPQNYPKTQPTGEPTYSYNRCAEDIFNVTAFIFATGEGAVLGERIYLHEKWFEPPTDASEEAVNMAARAAQLHVRYAPYLRGGYMLGKISIISDNTVLAAWLAQFRSFDDIQPLQAVCPIIQGEPADLKMGVDAISRGIDDDKFCRQVTSRRIQHEVWQKQFAPGDLRTLYLFANVGNTNQTLQFIYTKGLDLNNRWNKAIRLFDGRDSVGVQFPVAPVQLGQAESFTLAAHSLAAVAISRQP
jgi:hypothetical protein